MKHKLSTLLAVLLITTPIFAQTSGAPAAPASAPKTSKSGTVPPTHQVDGQTVWNQNCSRCHNAPQGFSPRISGTIVRHMRVRAGLSQEDAQALLRFLNP